MRISPTTLLAVAASAFTLAVTGPGAPAVAAAGCVRPLVVAHRGSGTGPIENSIASVSSAVNSTAQWIEFDVRASRDGVPFPYWRAIYTAGSTTGTPAVDATVDARTGDSDTPALHRVGAQLRAEGLLNGPVVLTGQSLTWVSSTATAFTRGFDAARPSAGGYNFVRSDLPNDPRVALRIWM